ncbi:hypothetical protein [Streptomyces katrae]|uniref:ScoMcrA-like SRA domain-containing protein n=1 Tax=Streptomyces katrae TaxID=68223 RepID=A0A0F4JTD2_9ACTN|nr:hypothetical protein [Streptomyces katrae]KJY36236.1 hypothetical protein VR44_08250 [Streptomyces katrae]
MTNEGQPIEPGHIYTRAEIRRVFGGSPYGGICPSTTSPSVVLYSDPSVGEAFGYHDGWLGEADAGGPIFEYTGAGLSGDQGFAGAGGAGNAAVLRHEQSGRALHLFVRHGKVEGTSTKTHRYVGRFTLDSVQPFVPRQGKGADGQLRTAIVFRLRPIDSVEPSPADDLEPAPSTSAEFVPRAITVEMLQAAAVTRTVLTTHSMGSMSGQSLAAAARGKLVGVEAFKTPKATRSAVPETVILRNEALLVDRYVAHLEARNHVIGAFQIRVKGATSTLRTDLYDATDHVLYEAKGSVSRINARMAMGQLLDYRRHVRTEQHPYPPKCAILLPEAPDEDIANYFLSHDISIVHAVNGGGFVSII